MYGREENIKMKYIDTHAHIYSNQFDEDRDATVQRAIDLGIGKILMPNVDSESIEGMMQCEQDYPEICVPMMGLHPCSVKEDVDKELKIVEEWLVKRKFIAIGEIGIDLYWDKTFQEKQIEALKIQIDWAIQYDVPIVLHTRESTQDVIKILEQKHHEKLRGVFHCFGGSVEEAKAITDLGFMLGLGGVTTFKKGGMDLVVPELSLDDIILETDCPYLAPVPYRGKRNEPSYMLGVASKIAEYKLISVEKVGEKTTANAKRLFGI